MQGYGWTQKLSYRMKSEREQISYINIYVWTLENGTDEPICKAEIKTDMENKYMDTKGERWGGLNWEIGFTYVHYYIQNR